MVSLYVFKDIGSLRKYHRTYLVRQFGYASSFSVYQNLYTRAGASTPSKISWIGSTQLFLMFAMGLPAGKLLDLGYFRHVILFGSILYTFW